MNEYLYKLKSRINCLPESYVNDILEDYKSYFYEGKEYGKTDEEMILELGDLEYISNNIIAEYFIENSNKINGLKSYAKALKSVLTLSVGAINLLVMIPIILSVLLLIASIYLIGIILLVSPLFLAIHIIMPNLPIYFGTNIAVFKLLIVLVMTTLGFIIINTSNKFSSKICRWSFKYIIKSIKFEAITPAILSLK